MRRILLLLCLFWACKGSVFGSHIVGGEFELLHVQDYRYRLNMLLYFDELNGNPGAKDPNVTVYIWRKSDNRLIQSVLLNLAQDTFVPYSNADCSDGQLVTSRILYTTTLTLSPDVYDHPDGYYVSWERCCRNYTITNIFSDDPQSGGGIAAGQTFYLEFPPVVRQGNQFVNSTPRLFPPLRDYGCVDKFYYVDFGGVDDDGDSLVYSLATPYSTIESTALPQQPNPGPYPEVVWQDGFSLKGVMGGDPDLAISTKGLLTVTPKHTGLYVFAVRCEEYRNGEKIGEMRRDFQMLVVSDCLNENPVVRAREEGTNVFYNESDVLNFNYADADKCLEILVTDKPVSGETTEEVSIRAIPINFDAELEGIEINFDGNVPITSVLDTARFTVCFPDCPYTRNGFYQIGIIGLDDACPQPALDTVIVSLNVPPPPNALPYYANAKGASPYTTITRSVMEEANGSLSVPINVFDDDGHDLSLSIEPLGFDLETVGMSFSDIVYAPGEAGTVLTWNYDCNADELDLSAGRDVSVGSLIRKAFDIRFVAEDADMCMWEDPQELLATLIIAFPDQTKPRVYRQGQPNLDQLTINHTVGSLLTLPIKADDGDGDRIILQGFAVDFNFEDFGTSFASLEGPGVPGITSTLNLSVPCDFDITERDQLHMLFTVEDLDACQLTNRDTLAVEVNLFPPVNEAPQLTFAGVDEIQIENDTLKLIVGQTIEGVFNGVDFENDSIVLTLEEVTPEVNGFAFSTARGKGQVNQPFVWTPDCSVFTGQDFSEDFTFTFLLSDLNCYQPMADTLTLIIHVEDFGDDGRRFTPPNFFSPNGDEFNQFFGPYRRVDTEAELVNILPLDNCAGHFERASIYNRWGRVVYESRDRDFKWYGKDEPPGVYYYLIKYSNREYKGWVTMMK